MTDTLTSPCIRICQLDQDHICIGCYRSAEEIGAWWQADSATQQAILTLARQRQRDYAARRRNNGAISSTDTTSQ